MLVVARRHWHFAIGFKVVVVYVVVVAVASSILDGHFTQADEKIFWFYPNCRVSIHPCMEFRNCLVKVP